MFGYSSLQPSPSSIKIIMVRPWARAVSWIALNASKHSSIYLYIFEQWEVCNLLLASWDHPVRFHYDVMQCTYCVFSNHPTTAGNCYTKTIKRQPFWRLNPSCVSGILFYLLATWGKTLAFLRYASCTPHVGFTRSYVEGSSSKCKSLFF